MLWLSLPRNPLSLQHSSADQCQCFDKINQCSILAKCCPPAQNFNQCYFALLSQFIFRVAAVWNEIAMHSSAGPFALFHCLVVAVCSAQGLVEHCGTRHLSVSSLVRHNDRIVGGKKALSGAWPWMASIVHKEIPMRFCGAALIDSSWVLTAAHCFKFTEFNDTDWRIELGRYTQEHEESYTLYRDVEKVSIKN